MTTGTNGSAPARNDHRPAVRLRLLGGFALDVDGERLSVADSSQRLLALLALRRGSQCRVVLADMLWPDKPETRAAANLRTALWRLPAPGGLHLVTCDGTQLKLSHDVLVDVLESDHAGWALVDDRCPGLGECDPDMFLVELLPGWYDDWVVFERERTAQLHLRFLEAMTHRLLALGQTTKALDVALRVVDADPFRERSQRALLAVYRSEGSLGEALRQYERYRRLIRETFGCEPSPELRAMVHIPTPPTVGDRRSNEQQPAIDVR